MYRLPAHSSQTSFPRLGSRTLPSIKNVFPEIFGSGSLASSLTNSPSFDSNTRREYFQQSTIVVSNQSLEDISMPMFDPKPNVRNRRRFHEVERIYLCTHHGCNKSYGALNHLNTHILSKGHGLKRSPQEFVLLRKQQKIKKNLAKYHFFNYQ